MRDEADDQPQYPVEPPPLPAPAAPHPAHRLLADLENECERFLGNRMGRIRAIAAEIRRTLP